MKATKKIYNLQSLNFLRYSKLKIGLLGGSFNPAHNGHVDISEMALKTFRMDYVIWLVANQNPLKEKYNKDMFVRAQDALEVVSNPRILVSTLEYDLGTMYAYDTLSKLKLCFPMADFTWLMGIDNVVNFHKWYRYQEFTKLCKMIIFDRPIDSRISYFGHFFSEFKPTIANSQCSNIIIHKGKLNDISSTLIRKQSNI